MMLRLKFLLLISVLQICSSLGQDFGFECRYKGDMCDVDPEKCLRRMKEENRGLISGCYGIQYGPEGLYNTREDTPFWINIAEWLRSEYPPGEDLTYTIYRKKVGRTNWTVPDSLTRIPGCCSMTMHDTCILPKREPGEAQYIFMPLYKQRELYCIFELEEESGEPERYCTNDDDVKCIEFVNGTVRKRGLYIALSTQFYQPITDFCFFTPPNNYVNIPNNTESYGPFTEKGISALGSGDDVIASLPTKNLSCTLVKGIREENIALLSAKHHQSWMGNFVCYFLRLPEFSGVWLDARCEEQILAREDDDWKVIIGVVVALCLAIIIAIIIVYVTWLYKKHLIKFTFEKTIEELPDTFSWDKLEGKRFIDDENVTITNSQLVKEIPDEFTFPYHKILPPQDREKALAKSTDQLLANGDSARYTKVALVDDIQEISSPATPECSDSGFHSDSGELKSLEDDSKRTDDANAKVSSNSEHDSGFSATFFGSGDSGKASPGLGPCEARDFSAGINGYTEKKLMLLGLPKKKMSIADDADETEISPCLSENSEKSEWDTYMMETSSKIPLYVMKSSLNSEGV